MTKRESEYISVTVYKTWVDVIDEYLTDDAAKGRLYSAIMHYSLYGDIPEFLEKWEKALFDSYIPSIDYSNANRRNGKKGGEANRKRNESEPEANRKRNESNVKEKENVNENVNVNGEESSAHAQEQYPQTLEELQAILESNPESNKQMTLANIQRVMESYLLKRLAVDWMKANGKKVDPDKIPYDFIYWCSNENPVIEKAKNRAMRTGKDYYANGKHIPNDPAAYGEPDEI